MNGRPKAVVLLSGGMDSAVTLAIAKAEGFDACALTVDYGQRHQHELEAARRVAQSLGAARHVVTRLDLGAFGGSALTGDAEVPKNRDAEAMAAEIPATYVPARNIILLSLALGWCEALGAEDIYIGVNAVDYSGYPDCRPAFIEQFQRLAGISTKAGVERKACFRIHAPLVEMRKGQIILAGQNLGVDFSLTHSCYDPAEDGGACGACDSCVLRRRGFAQAGIPDPTRYAA